MSPPRAEPRQRARAQSAPEVSVVVVTSGRETRLAFLLEALVTQTLDGERFEVVVVRDPQPGPTAAPPPGLRVLELDQEPGAGLAAARNRGWRAASGSIVAFTDDDCRPTPTWLETLVAGSGNPAVFVQGRTEPDPDEVHLLGPLARSQSITGPSPWYETCNIAYHRRLLERVGGFDERFAVVGEDTDLALRALADGARRRYAHEALTWHAVHVPHLPEAVSRALAWDVIPELVARHPVQRRALYGRVFWKESHAKLALGLAGSLLAPGRPALLSLAWLPYLDYRWHGGALRPRALLGRAPGLCARALVDLVELAVTVRAAARERVLVI